MEFVQHSSITTMELTSGASKLPEPTREARLYAVRELSRRAGVTTEFFRSWKVETRQEETVIYIQPGSQKRVCFKNTGATTTSSFHTVRASWMYRARDVVTTFIPDFVIPFCSTEQHEKRPLFEQVDSKCVECSFDLPNSILLTLARFEEVLPSQRDVHGRFMGVKSIAYRDGFLSRPIIDEYGLAFEQALQYLLPGWQPIQRKLYVKLSHDIDKVGIPFSCKEVLGHTVRRHNVAASFRDSIGRMIGLRPTYLKLIEDIIRMSIDHGLDSAVYWKASEPGAWDVGYDPRHPLIRQVVSRLRDHGVETGVHPGYHTFLAYERLQKEVESLRELLGNQPLGGRQHYLRWSPETWAHWESCNLAYDSSVGYADQVGFRAGTCFPYHPWLLSSNREAKLIEIPLLVMDCTPFRYMNLKPRHCLELIFDCIARCSCVGGVFTLLWHPAHLIDPIYSDTYANILERLAGHAKVDWKKDLY